MNRFLKLCLCKLMPLVLILCLMSSCAYKDIPSVETSVPEETFRREITWGITLDQMKCDFRFLEKNETISLADEIMEGYLYVDISFMDAIPYSMDSFDWNQEATASPATFQLYLQSLGQIKYLSYAALETGDPAYLQCAREFVESWTAYAHDSQRSDNNPKLWYDHGASLRAENLIYFMLTAEQLGVADDALRTLIYQLMVEHGEFLSADATYVKNHNHGIFQDEALMYVAALIPDYELSAQWMALAKERLQAQLDYAFTEEYVHVENSCGYCGGVINQFYRVSLFLLEINDSYGQKLTENISEMADFYARCFLPAGYPYALGDSFMSRKDNSHDNNYDNAYLEYVLTRGASGNPPKALSAYYPQSGYFFTQETFDKDALQDATWMMFKAGYVSATHKHADDLSILLYSKGHEIFLDSGMYNYMSGNIYRDYLISPRAHNTVNVDGMTYSTTVENSGKTGLLHFDDSHEYKYVLAYNDMYPGVEIDRHMYSLNDAIVLFDDIHSDDVHTYSQLFHLAEDAQIISEGPAETVLQIGATGYTVHIRQFGEMPALSVLRGEADENGLIYGFASDSINEIHPINTLKYELSGSDVQFITIEDESGKIKLTDADSAIPSYADAKEIRYAANNRTLTLGEFEIVLTPRAHTDMSDIQVSIDADTLTVRPSETINGMSYLWYLVDADSSTVLEKSSWSTDGMATFILPENGVLLKSYIKDEYGQRRSRIVGGWTDAESGRQFINPDVMNYRHTEDTVSKIAENTYQITAGTDYALDYIIRWYVYKNGSYFTNITTSNENQITIDLADPGIYNVSYYFRTTNGEQEYWIMPELVIP